jgi:riboflavin synthase
MFTGIITDVGRLVQVTGRPDLKRLRIACAYDPTTIDQGASIAVNGVCMTVVAKGGHNDRWFEVDAAAETLALTTAGRWAVGTPLNLERALRLGDELGGHLVSGHVDGIATLIHREDLDGMVRLTIGVPEHLARYIAPKGSVAVDGISLTVNAVNGAEFTVLLIPQTLELTHWRDIAVGQNINLEIDTLARYVARLADYPQPR